VQGDPNNPTLKPPKPKRLKLTCDCLLANFAFKFNLRRYIWMGDLQAYGAAKAAAAADSEDQDKAGGYAVFQGTSNGGQRVSSLRP
jgi:hypothetical protein